MLKRFSQQTDIVQKQIAETENRTGVSSSIFYIERTLKSKNR